MEREIIIQISAQAACEGESKIYNPVLYGLSNKGRLFIKGWMEYKWTLLNPGIPEELQLKEKD